MRYPKYMQNVLIGATAFTLAGSHFVPGADKPGPVMATASAIATGKPAATTATTVASAPKSGGVTALTSNALSALSGSVRKLSHPKALEDAFTAYFSYKTAHPNDVKKPYLYFVDYGLASTESRGYVFDMDALKIIDGPFTVAHGRGSSTSQYGVPTKFSNGSGSSMTSLGLYLTKATYAFTGHSAGSTYHSIGLRLDGVSDGFNDKALARGVVAHGAPYVTPSRAGRSQGCPAMEPARAQKLLPKLANGAMVFLFAPNQNWMQNDQWVNS